MTWNNLLTHDHSKGFGAILHHFFEWLGFSHELTEFISHVIIDCVEVIALLLLVMTAVYYLESYLKFNALKEKLSKLKSIWGYGLALILGMLSPFCSCSIIPVIMGLLSIGVPLSVCICMLTSASLLNLTTLMGAAATLGLRFALIYGSGALLLIAAASVLFAKLPIPAMDLHRSSDLEEEHHCHDGCCHEEPHHHPVQSKKEHLWAAFHSAWELFCSIWMYILLGVGLSAALSTFFPMEHIVRFVDENSFLSGLLALSVGFVLHADLFSILPILKLLGEISFPIMFIFAWSALSSSIPSLILLTRVLRSKWVVLYAALLVLLSWLLGMGLLLLF